MTDTSRPIWHEADHLPLRTRPLGILTVMLVPQAHCFETPRGQRKIVQVAGGSLVGPRISAEVLAGGGDWALTLCDGVLTLDVRLMLRCDDGALIYMTYGGMRHAPPEVTQRLSRGEAVDPAAMYFRTAPRFETGDPRYAWLNRLLAVGVGERLSTGPRYHIHEIL